jgi:hypothetical protein
VDISTNRAVQTNSLGNVQLYALGTSFQTPTAASRCPHRRAAALTNYVLIVDSFPTSRYPLFYLEPVVDCLSTFYGQTECRAAGFTLKKPNSRCQVWVRVEPAPGHLDPTAKVRVTTNIALTTSITARFTPQLDLLSPVLARVRPRSRQR